MEKYCVAYRTDVGIKKKTNQDSLLIKGVSNGKNEALFAVICDGMGGMARGELASATAVRDFSEWFLRDFMPSGINQKKENIRRQWLEVLREMNRKLISYGRINHIQLGTTVTAILLLPEGEYQICHVGDTRIYKVSEQMEQLSEDHTFVEREVKKGNMTPEQAAVDSRKNVLLQCIGVNSRFEPQFLEGRFLEQDGILLCSDGFRHRVTEDEIFSSLQECRYKDKAGIEDKLIKLVELNKQRGETDNISAIFIQLK